MTGADADWLVVIVAEHRLNVPEAKSDSVAVVDCDERVSARKLEKHVSPNPRSVRSRPPSKNVPVPNWFAVT